MCGIAGMGRKSGATPGEALLRGMSGALAHRGPDGEGMWRAPGVGLVHRRLAIIDLSPRAAQPMHDARGEYTIVFNGEIYNYRELRDELGGTLQSDSDTEVILEGYRRWGNEVVTRLRGMFAFALWDATRGSLLIARDRIGKKPLFYSVTAEGDLVFASEIKGLHGVIDLRPDMSSLRLFLGLQYVPSPRTGFQDVMQLEPGCFATWSATDGLRIQRYHTWHLPEINAELEQSNADIDAQIRSQLEEAVKVRQLAADVSVGAFLSGGIDSAAIVALASKHVSQPLQTFTMGFDVDAMDERAAARDVADSFSTDHHEYEARAEDLPQLLDTIVSHYDAPYADSSALPLWLLAQQTAQSIKVVLTGDGGDEVFGGYRRYSAYDSALRVFTQPIVSQVLPPVAMYIGSVFRDPRFERMADTVRALRLKPEHAYGEIFCSSYFGTRGIREICQPAFLEATHQDDAVAFVGRAMGGTSSLDAAMLFDLTSYLPDDLNVKMDRATMAFGLEARAPFLDQELIRFALTLPTDQKVSHTKTKIALRRALKDILPGSILRRPKRGFQVPLAVWFRGPLRELVRNRCLDPRGPLASILQLDAIHRLIEQNDRGADHGNRLWMLVCLATWLRNTRKM